ncbi:MAG: hypothetical protein JXB03_08250, partial [Spirochaetales bacterium]|nr:hypothetical protein [Spirochaetales bacterium]
MKKLVACLVLNLCIVHVAAQDFHVDLNKFPLYVRMGFSADELNQSPRKSDTRWLEFPAAGPAGRTVRLKDLHFEGLPKRPKFSFFSYGTMEFTYHIPFELNRSQASVPASGVIPGLHIAAIGDNWEIYINGQRVHAAVDLDKEGNISRNHDRRTLFFPFAPELLT